MMPSFTNLSPESYTAKGELRQLKPLLHYLTRYRWQIMGALLALLTTSSAVLGMGGALRYLVDEGLSKGDAALLDRAYEMLLGVVLVLAAASYARFFLVAWLGEKVIADIRRDVYRHLVSMHVGFFETTKTGELLSRLTTDTTLLQTVIGGSVSVALRNGIMLLGGCTLLLLTSPKLTGYVLLMVPVVVVPIVIFGRRVRRASRQTQDSVAGLSAHAEETLSGIRTIQALALEPQEISRFEAHVQNVLKAGLFRIRSKSWMTSIVITLVFGSIVTVLWMGGKDVLSGAISPGQLSAFVFYSAIVAGAVGALSEVMGDLQRAAGAAERLRELLALRPEIAGPAYPQMIAPDAAPAIALEGVTFTYPARPEKPALEGVSLHVAPGETLALVGHSGAGKTTIFQLLLRFYDPEQGVVRFAGVDVRELDPRALRLEYGIVPQDPAIFSGTIRENILCGNPQASEEAVAQAAEAAMVMEFAGRFPLGLETPVGERGVQLSGGQKQRVAIARAIIRNPKVLLLDEATSALDAENERLVRTALNQAMHGRTTLIIAHRLSTVLHANRIVLLDQGRVEAIGTHAELLVNSNAYAKLARLQLSDAA